MSKKNQSVKNGFESKPATEKLEILNNYVNKYHGGSKDKLIDFAISEGVVGVLLINSNYKL